MDGFAGFWERIAAGAGARDRIADALRLAIDPGGRDAPRDAPSIERLAIAVTGLAAAAAAAGLAVVSLAGLALAAAVLYVVLTRVFGLEISLDPSALFGAAWPGRAAKT